MPPKQKKIDPELQKVNQMYYVGIIRGMEREGRIQNLV